MDYRQEQSHNDQKDYNDFSDNEGIIETQLSVSYYEYQKRKQKKQADIEIIKSLLDSRSDQNELQEKLKSLKFFRRIQEEIPQDSLHELFEKLNYQFVPQFKPVYRQGENSKAFYIILEGSVVILKSKDKLLGRDILADNEILPLMQTKSQGSPVVQELRRSPSKQSKLENMINPLQYILNSFPTFTHVKSLRTGSSFGEIALKLDVTRTSTVVAATNLHLLYISAQTYKKLLNPFFSMILDRKIDFFQNHFIFKQVPLEQIMGIILELHYKSYQANQEIYKEGSISQNIYFIVKGQVQLRKSTGLSGVKEISLSVYIENQMFGANEILNKTNRFYLEYDIQDIHLQSRSLPHKTKFFDNLGNFRVYDTMKQLAQTIEQSHESRFQKRMDELVCEKDQVYANMDKLPTNKLSNSILNSRILKQHEQSQIKHFNQLAINDNNQDKLIQNRFTLQKIYCNSIQGFYEKIMKEPSQLTTLRTDSIRGQGQSSRLVLDDMSRSISDLKNISSLSLLTTSPQNVFSHAKLTTLPVSPDEYAMQTSIKPVLQSLSILPRVKKDNFVLRLLKQQALSSKNPKVEQRKIEQALQMAQSNILNKGKKRFTSKSDHKLILSNDNQSLNLLRVLKIKDVVRYGQMK